MNLMRRLLPVVCVALALLPAGCSDEECTSGTVRVAATIPAEVAAGVTAVDVSFEIAGQLVHMQRLPVAPGAMEVEADITLPGGYPAGKRVVVTAVAKRVGPGGDVAVATWFQSQEFPSGCVGFVFNLFAGNTMDGGTSEGGVLFIDGGAFEGGVDGNTVDGGAADAAQNGGNDGGTDGGVDAASDAANDAPAI